MKKLLLILIVLGLGVLPASAYNLHSKVGAHATVSPRYAAKFQALINDLEAHGAIIKFMGGYRPGRCEQAHKHPCGMALDLCQYSRDVVDKRCHLTRAMVNLAAAQTGLFSGARWCASDYGHVEAGGSVACGHSWVASARGRGYHESHYHHVVRVRRVNYASASPVDGPGSVTFH